MATAQFIQDGNAIDHTPASDPLAGSVVVQGTLVGITKRDIATGQLGTLELTGVFDLPKATGTDTAIAAGSEVYWKPAAGEDPAVATTDADDGGEPATAYPYLGKAIRAATDADATVRVRLSQ
jgi:predicted RecA/RadA family phage recombinase